MKTHVYLLYSAKHISCKIYIQSINNIIVLTSAHIHVHHTYTCTNTSFCANTLHMRQGKLKCMTSHADMHWIYDAIRSMDRQRILCSLKRVRGHSAKFTAPEYNLINIDLFFFFCVHSYRLLSNMERAIEKIYLYYISLLRRVV